MSDTASNDVLMYFIPKAGGTAIPAESTTNAVGSERLMEGFVKGKYFDAENFSISIELEDDEGAEVINDSEVRSYARWRGLKSTEPKPVPPFRAEPGDASITRLIDSSSPVLLKHCLDTEEFDKAVLVKRARIGKAGMMTVVLRMEFSKVWLKAIEWEDGDTVRETCKFKFNSMKVTYAKMKPDGSPGPLFPCEWTAYQKPKP